MLHRVLRQIQGGEYTTVWGTWHKTIGSHSTSTKPFALVLRLVFRWVFSGCFSIKSSIDMCIHRYKYILYYSSHLCLTGAVVTLFSITLTACLSLGLMFFTSYCCQEHERICKITADTSDLYVYRSYWRFSSTATKKRKKKRKSVWAWHF